MTKIRVRVEDGRKSLPNVTADKGVQCGKENGPCVCLSHEEEHQPLPSVGTTVRIDSEDDEDTKAAKKRGRETLGARKVCLHQRSLGSVRVLTSRRSVVSMPYGMRPRSVDTSILEHYMKR